MEITAKEKIIKETKIVLELEIQEAKMLKTILAQIDQHRTPRDHDYYIEEFVKGLRTALFEVDDTDDN